MSYQIIIPANGEAVHFFEEATCQQLEAALNKAASCFAELRRMSFPDRAAIANKAS